MASWRSLSFASVSKKIFCFSSSTHTFFIMWCRCVLDLVCVLLLVVLAAPSIATCTTASYSTPANFLNHTNINKVITSQLLRVSVQGFTVSSSELSYKTGTTDDLSVTATIQYSPAAFSIYQLFNLTRVNGQVQFDLIVQANAVSAGSVPSASWLVNGMAAGLTASSLLMPDCRKTALAAFGLATAVTSIVKPVYATTSCPVSLMVNVTLPQNYSLHATSSLPFVELQYYIVSNTISPTHSPSLSPHTSTG
jgi:hypothetical protein